VDIVLAVGRAIRKAENKKVGTIVIPVFIGTTEGPGVALDDSAFKPVWDVIRALRAHERRLGRPARHAQVDATGKVSLRYDSKLYKIGIGRAHRGRAVKLLIADLEIRVIDSHGELLRELTLDPAHLYQPLGRSSRVQDVPTHVSGITRDFTIVETVGIEPTSVIACEWRLRA
jgi:hypothetical protein